MKILILGGTQYVGRHLTEAALEVGHEVTLFNRGKTNPGIYPDAEEIHGDRVEDLDKLAGRTWDVVFDTAAYVPRVLRKSAEALQNAVGRYVFISSISVYAAHDHTTEGDPVRQLEDPTNEDVSRFYGELKAACESVIAEIYGDRGLNVRPGAIVGRYDVTTRLPYLIRRYDVVGSDGKPVERIAGRPEQPTQLIHARDLADWMLGAVEQGLSGEYNVTGHPITIAELLEVIIAATGREITVIYTGDDFLKANEIKMQDGITYWIPKEYEDIRQVSIQKALATGLKFRSLAEMVGDVLAWTRQTPAAYENVNPAVVTPEREAELLAQWHQLHG